MATTSQIQEVVPRATFVENVSDFVKGRRCLVAYLVCLCILPMGILKHVFNVIVIDKDVDTVLRDVQANLQRYKHVEVEIAQRRQRLAVKQPEIEKCLDAVNLLIERKEADDDVGYLSLYLDSYRPGFRITCYYCLTLCRPPF